MMRKLPDFLWWLRPNTFQSEDDIWVVLLSRHEVMYHERDHSVRIYQEVQAAPKILAIERGSIRAWEPPFELETIEEGDRTRLVENIRRALAPRKYSLVLLDD